MAQLLNILRGLRASLVEPPGGAAALPSRTSFWPVDKLIFTYLAFTTVVTIGWWRFIPEAPAIAALHAVAVAALIFEVKRPNPTTWFFHNWYPLLYVAACYKEMAVLVPAVRNWRADPALAKLDYRLWNANPTVWLERIQAPALTELLQTVYTLFIPAVLLVAFLIWVGRRYANFQYYAFLIAFGYLASYAGYLLVPARGPRFLLAALQHAPLRGLWLFGGMQAGLDRLESVNYDCFPSGHTELTILACWGSRLVSKRLFRVYLFYTPPLIFATVYLRYHYSVDVLAGAALALVLILAAPSAYRKLTHRGCAIGSH